MHRTVLVLIIFVLTLVDFSAYGQSSLDNILSLSRLPYLKSSKLIQIASTDTSGKNDDFIQIPAGASVTIADITGPGVVVQFWCTIDSPDKFFLRHIVLKIYWDNEESPSVEVPIGDYFGTGFRYKQWLSLLLGMSSGGYYSYIPMPFNTRAKVVIANETGGEIYSFYYHLDYQKLSEPLDSSVAYFHATWRREIHTDPHHSYTILDATGRGQFIGMNLNMQSYDGGLGFLEGDEQITVDGESKPSIQGTGTEDYFNSGWYFNRGEFSAPYHGLILMDDSLGRIAAYRFHVLDAIPFQKSIHVAIEHGDRNTEVADYSSTAYWYQKEPHKPFSEMLPPGLRTPLRVQVPTGAVEAEALPPASISVPGAVEDMTLYGADWSGGKQLRIVELEGGRSFVVRLPGAEERCNVKAFFTKGPSYGNVRLVAQGKTVGEFLGYNLSIVPGGSIAIKNVESKEGLIALKFEITGKHPAATGYDVGLDAFTVEPVRTFIRKWDLLGPFPNPRDQGLIRRGIDIVYPPEKEFLPRKVYEGVEGQKIRWSPIEGSASGFVNLQTLTPSDLVVVYAHTSVYSPVQRSATLLLGSDDGAKVFVNGAEVFRFMTIRGARPDQDTVALPLRKGWNSLLLKVENNFGGFGYFARVIDPSHELIFKRSAR